MKIHVDVSYGVFLGGDPGSFSPDPECSTEEERENWRKACARGSEEGTDFFWTIRALGCPAGPGFGLGVNTIEVACDGATCEACKYLGEPEERS